MTALPRWALEALSCTRCHSAFGERDRALVCSGCGLGVPIENGVPLFPVGPGPGSGLKLAQRRYFDHEIDAEHEQRRPRGDALIHGRLLASKLEAGIGRPVGDLRGRTVVVVCGGSGMEAEFLALRGARVISIDISPMACTRALGRAAANDLEICALAADAESLPVRDRGVDGAFVHDGLHHLGDPAGAITELTRISKRWVSINEPVAALATRLAVRVGLAEAREESGNPVLRLDAAHTEALVRGRGFTDVTVERRAMLYRHTPGPLYAFASRRRISHGAWRALELVASVAGPVGNKLSLRARRPDDQEQ